MRVSLVLAIRDASSSLLTPLTGTRYLSRVGSKQNTVSQLLMGEGKTTVVLPLLALLISSNGLCITVVPRALLRFTVKPTPAAHSILASFKVGECSKGYLRSAKAILYGGYLQWHSHHCFGV